MRNSIVILSKGIKIDKNYNNVLDYSENDLLSLMRENGYLISESNNYSFVDEYQTQIIVQNKYEDVYLCNYLAFQNPRYSYKWFFCFVDRIEYNSENSTKITFHTDIWSTWYNNLVLKESYVLREHVSDDTIGKNTIDEGLNIGGVVAEDVITDNDFNSNHYICVATNWNPHTKLGFVGANIYTRVVWGSFLAVFPFTQEGITQYQYFVQQTNADGHPEDIHDIFIIPRRVCNEI